jgi:hypothetical protein
MWNRLFDQEVDAGLALSVLEAHGFCPVLGYNVLYEVAKCFSASNPEMTLRGQNLCKYLKSFMVRRIPLVMENWALLIEEAFHAAGTPIDRGRKYEENFAIAFRQIGMLSEGNFEDEAANFITNRKLLARDSRIAIRDSLNSRPRAKAMLLSIDEDALPQFMDDHCLDSLGQRALQAHLRVLFPDDLESELAAAAWRLLLSRRYPVARAFTRADIYLWWRCVRYGSIRGDLPDDVFHITAAAYCDDFLTTESDQAAIASKVIDGIRARVYTGDEPVLQWLAAA